MHTISNAIVEIPCLGRVFQPGKLYDCRNDQLIPAITLWNPDKLKNSLNTQAQPFTHSEMITEDSISEKSSKLGVDAHLKLSFLGGLFSVNGSAHYLSDYKHSKKQARVSLKYSSTSHSVELSMGHFGANDVQHPQIFDNGDATHVVIGVLYGADAIFVFDHESTTSKEAQKVSGDLKIAMKKMIDSLQGGGGAGFKFSETEKELYNTTKCHFYGDFHLKENVSTLLDAMKVYRELPTRIKEEGTVAKRAWLYPLAKLDSKAAKLVRQISINLITQTERLIEALHKAEMNANDLLTLCHPMFVGLKQQVTSFKQHLKEFKLNIEERLHPVLPLIRGGGECEEVLMKILDDVKRSPFAPVPLCEWIKGKQEEIEMLNNVIEQLKSDDITITNRRADVNKIFQNFQNNHVLGLVFNAGGSTDSYLDALKSYLRVGCTEIESHGNSNKELVGTTKKELQQINKALVTNMRRISHEFVKFAKINSKNESLQFIVYAEESKNNHHYVSTRLHDLLEGTEKEFTLPSAPVKPWCFFAADLAYGNVNERTNLWINWGKIQQGQENVTSFKIEYITKSENIDWTKATQIKSKSNIPGWGMPDCSDNWFRTYVFRVCSECIIGDSEFSEPSDPFRICSSVHLSTPKWVTVRHHAPFPANAIAALGGQRLQGGDSTTQNSYVALWCNQDKRGRFGRAWNNNGLVEAWFPDNTATTGPIDTERYSEDCGEFTILTDKNPHRYKWVNLNQLKNSEYNLISRHGVCPAVVTASGRAALGMADPFHGLAWTTYDGKVFCHEGSVFSGSSLLLVRQNKASFMDLSNLFSIMDNLYGFL